MYCDGGDRGFLCWQFYYFFNFLAALGLHCGTKSLHGVACALSLAGTHGLSYPVSYWNFNSLTRNQILSPALEGRFSTTGPPGKSPVLDILYLRCFIYIYPSRDVMSGIRAIGQGGSWVDYMKQNIDRFSSHEAGWVSQKWEEETKGKRQKIVPSAPHLLAAWWRQKSCQGDWDRVASEVGRNQGSQETLSINIPYFYQSSLSVNIRKHKLCDCLLVSLQPLVQTWNAEWRVSGCGLQGPLSFPLSLASRLIPLPGSRDLVK